MALDKQTTHFIEVHSLSHDGRGIATLDGKTVFVQGALPGETVHCQMVKKHRRYLEAKATAILTSAPERALPLCEHFDICGGCSMQHLKADHQIAFKQKTFLEQLHHFGRVAPVTLLPPLSGPLWGYRRKARLGVRFVHKKNKLLVGFREKSSNYLADIQSCAVLHPTVGTRIEALALVIRQLNQFQHIAQVEVAVGDQATAMVVRHLSPLPEEDIARLRAFGETHQLLIYLQPGPPESLHLITSNGPQKLSYDLPDFKLTMEFHPLDFVQVNSEINRSMIQQALQLLTLGPTERVLDLFCGLGNFTLPMARFASHVHGVEGSLAMVERATQNAALNHIMNTTFFAANLMSPSEEAVWAKQTYDKILLDPPRSGAKELLPLIPRWGAKKIVYISCNPATLARDAGELVHQYGYRLTKAGIINMFPQTSHVEAIALFEKGEKRDHGSAKI